MSFGLKQISKLFLLTFLAIATSQCSKKEGLSGSFEVEVLGSTQPLVRISKRQIGRGEIQPNWFDYSFNIVNTSGYDVRIEEILFYVIVDGVEQPPKYFDLGLMTIVDSNDISYDYPSYCTYRNNYRAQLRMCRSASTMANENELGPLDDSKNLTLYVGSLPDSALGTGVYRVRMEVYGVFMDSNGKDIERLIKRHYFTTR